MRSLACTLIFAISAAAALPLACGGGDDASIPTTSDNGFGGGDVTSAATGSGGDLFGQGGSVPSVLSVMPPSATIDVVNGVAAPVDFAAMMGESEVTPSWVVDYSAIAGVDANGVVSATAQQGGLVTLTATYMGQTATAQVTVKLKDEVNAVGATDADKILLGQAVAPDPSTQWAYPYDKTVFPKGLLAPELMWNGGSDGDLYFVRFTGKYAELEVYTSAPPPSRFTVDDTSWKKLTESGTGGPIDVTVARLVPGSGSATVVASHSWTIANGSLRGTVYYWANSLGRVLRIKPGSAAPDDFLAAGGQTGCSTCHAVSANGSTLILGGDISVSNWNLLTNSSVLDIGSVGKYIRNWAMPAISPDGKIVVENNAPLPGPPGGSDGMFDAQTGAKLFGTGLDGAYLWMPAFGPDGTKLAFVDASSLGLAVYDYNAASPSVSNRVDLVPAGGDGNLNCIAFPSVSPDAKWVVYHRGQYSNSLDTRSGPGNLYLASIAQPGVEYRLSQTNGDNYPFAAGGRDLNQNYEPTFAPLNAGGYAWVVFTGRRTYGNRLTGGSESVKQLWVAAIDQSPAAGVDPSHPAFWVPGQDMNTLNMRGFWALDPCKQVGDACSTGSECCNQNCEMGTCTEPDPSECAENGNHCETDADCCDPGAKCINHICSEPPPT
jgi:hypothetical protein